MSLLRSFAFNDHTHLRGVRSRRGTLDKAPCCGTVMNKPTLLPHRSALPRLPATPISQRDLRFPSGPVLSGPLCGTLYPISA